ncbi:MAG: DMT family transporter [Anaerolineae bacterium]|nr:DMT family transporter [Anaerolineae bacterium]
MRAALVLLVGVLVMAWASILVRWAAAPPLVIGAGRLSLATLLLAPLALPATLREWSGASWKRWVLLTISGIALGLHFATWLTSLGMTSVASSVVLVSTTPLFVAVASPVVLGERVGRAMLMAALLAMAGATIIGLADARTTSGGLLGDLLALAGALMAGVYVLVGRVLRREVSLLAYIWPIYGLAAVALLAGCALTHQPLVGYDGRTYALVALLAIGPQLVGHSSVNWALRYLSPAFVTVAILGEPLGATVLALLLLAERPGWTLLIGGALLLLGIGLAVRSEQRALPT